MALQQLRSRFRILQNPGLIKLFSTTNSSSSSDSYDLNLQNPNLTQSFSTTSSSSECDDPNEEEEVVNQKYKGVCRERGKWAAQITDPQKRKAKIWLGTPQEASRAYHQAVLRFGDGLHWSTSVKKYYIDLCVKEINEKGRLLTRLRPQSWIKVSQQLEKKFGSKFNQNQLSSQWVHLRRQYIAWSKLMNAAGSGYNAKTHTFDWSEDKWAEFTKMVSESSKFRKKPLQFASELRTLFGSTVETENDENKPQLDDMPCSTSNSDQFSDAGVHRRKTLTTSDDANDQKIGASVEECVKSLNEPRASHDLPRHLYSAALKSFCQGKEYRIVWMAVTAPEDRVSFLQSLL
ncbi:uncharacterized protein LOC113329587 isoform X1 [Papaver somniferum]|uniref:uncharacterized protein LOC113329587 isoform X1 n=1 Tax=Papaver somniferum TaxID=3469 RepID=UPI000E6F5F06|nr:uncharacterized protein LOC113329587 isoform X1 [Papaver somniferum]